MKPDMTEPCFDKDCSQITDEAGHETSSGQVLSLKPRSQDGICSFSWTWLKNYLVERSWKVVSLTRDPNRHHNLNSGDSDTSKSRTSVNDDTSLGDDALNVLRIRTHHGENLPSMIQHLICTTFFIRVQMKTLTKKFRQRHWKKVKTKQKGPGAFSSPCPEFRLKFSLKDNLKTHTFRYNRDNSVLNDCLDYLWLALVLFIIYGKY